MAAGMVLSSAALPAAAAETAGSSYEYCAGAKTKVTSKFVYKITGKNSVAILDFKKKAVNSKGMLVFPAKLGGKKVTKLGAKKSSSLSESFEANADRIKSVKIPDTVKKIEARSIHIYSREQPASISELRRSKLANITFYCTHGSAGEKYAAENGFKYKLYGENKDFLTAPRINSKVGINGSSVKISWKAVSGAEGYTVYSAEEFANGWGKGTDVGNTLSFSNEASSAGCYYKVEAYRTVNGKKEVSLSSAIKYVVPAKQFDLKLVSKNRIIDGNGRHPGFWLDFEKPDEEGNVIAEIKDPYDGKWYTLGYFSYDSNWEDGFEPYEYIAVSFNSYRKTMGNKVYAESIDEDQTYTVRVGFPVFVSDAVSPVTEKYDGYYYHDTLLIHNQFDKSVTLDIKLSDLK